jgi:hypothetical protein
MNYSYSNELDVTATVEISLRDLDKSSTSSSLSPWTMTTPPVSGRGLEPSVRERPHTAHPETRT